VVTGVLEVWSRAPACPTPCGYTACIASQFEKLRDTGLGFSGTTGFGFGFARDFGFTTGFGFTSGWGLMNAGARLPGIAVAADEGVLGVGEGVAVPVVCGLGLVVAEEVAAASAKELACWPSCCPEHPDSATPNTATVTKPRITDPPP
jgi:hypothetical protein